MIGALVDDEELVRTVTGRMLRRMGFAVRQASKGEEAVQAVRDHGDALQLVLLDLTMPGMGGVEVMDHIATLCPSLPVLVISGYAQQDACERFQRAVPSGFLQKPYNQDQLRAAIAAALGEGRRRTEPPG
ncbi:MAG: response regulator [Deltaproteobacteria bacterium]|nr:response regulator [Deltaproteobacteria bacterium]